MKKKQEWLLWISIKKLIMLKLNILRTQLQKCLRNYKADADVSHICSPKKLYNTEQKEKMLFLTRT